MAVSDRDKRTLKYGGIAVGVLVVIFLALKLLGGGGGGETATTFSPRPTTSASGSTGGGNGGGQGSESPTLAPSPVLVLPVRDPFAIPPGFPAPGGTSSGGTSSTGTSTSTSTGTGTGTSTSTSTGTGTGTGPPTQPSSATLTIGGHQVTLIDTFTTNGVERTTVEVDGTTYSVAAGDKFGPNKQYQLQSVSGNCATFLFGDQSFTLCVPQNK
jgi:hypothetical protein